MFAAAKLKNRVEPHELHRNGIQFRVKQWDTDWRALRAFRKRDVLPCAALSDCAS